MGIIFDGLRFPSGYVGVPSRHRIFGGLQRLNAKTGDDSVHFFMEGYPGGDIDPALAPQEKEPIIWRQSLQASGELASVLRTKGITKLVIAGLKVRQSVLS